MWGLQVYLMPPMVALRSLAMCSQSVLKLSYNQYYAIEKQRFFCGVGRWLAPCGVVAKLAGQGANGEAC